MSTAKPAKTDESTKTSEGSRRPYHHGDLRRAILTAALDVIAADGPSALSLRDLARRAGVSHAAPAHHFKDRTGLLTAIAAEGFGLLAGAIGEAADLKDAGVRYVRFAREHPAHFQVMFAPELLRDGDLELTTARALATDALRHAVSAVPPRAAAPTTVSPVSPRGPWRTASRRCSWVTTWTERWVSRIRRRCSGCWRACCSARPPA